MINDSERREIAARLRELADANEGYLGMGRVNRVLRDGKAILGTSGLASVADVLRRHADLIDRPITTRHGKFRTKYSRKTPCCEICGYSIGDMRWNYCPKCGAVITND